jgi:hypothetical protein
VVVIIVAAMRRGRAPRAAAVEGSVTTA